MVLIQSKKHIMKTERIRKNVLLFLFALFCFTNYNTYAEYLGPSMSIFVIKDISEEARNNLEWVEHHINYVNDKYRNENYPLDGYFQEFTLYNNGNVPYTVRMGVGYQYASEAPRDLFKVNGVQIRHQLDYDWLNPFAFIDVVFPPRQRTKIRVNDFSGTVGFDEKASNQTTAFVFRGSPKFTAKIGNYSLDEEHQDFGIERNWIDGIYFKRKDSFYSDSLVAMIEEEGSLSNRLFNIQKTNENTWEFEFTTEFVNRYRDNLYISIAWGQWGVNRNMNGVGLRFKSEEELSPYRYVFLTNKQLQVVRNAYYARHGYIFRNDALGRMYEGFYWPGFGNINYKPNPNFHEGMLTEIDRANIEIIRRLEALAEN